MSGYLMIAVAATVWGAWAFFLRPSGLTGSASALLVFLVMSLPAPLLVRREAGRGAFRDRRAVHALLLLGVTDALNAALFFAALQRGPVAVGVLTHYLAPLLVALSAPWLLGERRSFRALIAAPVTLLGLALVLEPWRGEFPLQTALLGGGSALFYAANILTSKRANASFSPLAVTSLHSPISVLTAAVVMISLGEPFPAPSATLLPAVAGAFLCGLFGVGLFNAGLKRVSAQGAGALTYLEPLSATVFSAIAFSEALSPLAAVGAALILGGGVWVALEKKPEPTARSARLPSTNH